MKQIKAILELILAIAGCIFRFRKAKEDEPEVPKEPDPPLPPDGRERDHPGSPGDDDDPAEQTRTTPVNILGWCLILTAAMSWIYNQLA